MNRCYPHDPAAPPLWGALQGCYESPGRRYGPGPQPLALQIRETRDWLERTHPAAGAALCAIFTAEAERAEREGRAGQGKAAVVENTTRGDGNA